MSRINTEVPKIYFTVLPTRNSGFTDQLTQFIGMYRLGVNMGYIYYHTDLRSNRSKYNLLNRRTTFFSKIIKKVQVASRILKRNFLFIRGFDVFDSIGFNQYFRETGINLDLKNFEIVNLKITNEFLADNKIFSLPELKNYINSIVNNRKGKKVMVVFDIKKGRKILKIVYPELSRTNTENGLRNKYFELRINSRWNSKFKKDKRIKIMMHVRQGDTSVIETPWNTYIPVFALYEYIEDKFAELQNRDDLKTYRNIEVNDYYSFLQKLISEYDEKDFSVLVFSDGFKRGFDRIYQNIDKLEITKRQKDLLMKSEKSYDRRMFGIFDNINCVEKVVGEDDKNLMQLIHSFFDADIVIIGNQQSMIPKLMAVYCDIENMPFVIVLYKRNLPQYSYLEDKMIDRKFIFIDVESPYYGELLDFINLKIYGSHG